MASSALHPGPVGDVVGEASHAPSDDDSATDAEWDAATAEPPSDDSTSLKDPATRLTLAWALTQCVPSLGASVARQTFQFHMSWQLTPLLYGWGLQPGLSPWRTFIAEPSVRQSGSIELFLSPEYFGIGSDLASKWGVRAGIRSYFPLLARGEYLSLSVGSGVAHYQGQNAPSYEVGLHVLFGTLGLVGIVNPGLAGGEGTVLVKWRYY